MQKQSPWVLSVKMFLKIFKNFIPSPSILTKLYPSSLQFIKKETSVRKFFYEFSEIFI